MLNEQEDEVAVATYVGLFIVRFVGDRTSITTEHLNGSLVNSVRVLKQDVLVVCTTDFQLYNWRKREITHTVSSQLRWFPKSLTKVGYITDSAKAKIEADLYLVVTNTTLSIVDMDSSHQLEKCDVAMTDGRYMDRHQRPVVSFWESQPATSLSIVYFSRGTEESPGCLSPCRLIKVSIP